MYLFEKKTEKISLGKIIAISAAVAVGVAALCVIAYKLWERYCPCCCDEDFCDCDDECCDDECCCCDEPETPVVDDAPEA